MDTPMIPVRHRTKGFNLPPRAVKALATVSFLLTLTIPATAQLYVTADRTIANGDPITGDNDSGIVVGRNQQDDNFFGINADLVAANSGPITSFNDSIVTFYSGSILGAVYSRDKSNFTIAGGEVFSPDVQSFNQSNLSITGGMLAAIQANDQSIVTISGGMTPTIVGLDDTTINIYDTDTQNIAASFMNSTLNISGGNFYQIASSGESSGCNFGGSAVTRYLQADVSGHINVTGGTITNEFLTVANSTATIMGGDFGSGTAPGQVTPYAVTAAGNSVIDFGGDAVALLLQSAQNGVINVTGGTIGDISVGVGVFNENNSTINLYGGKISQNTIRSYGDGVLNVYGFGLSLSALGTGIDLGGATYTDYLLTGTLQNGDILDTHFFDYNGGFQIADPGNPNGPSSPINLFGVATVPEPGTLALVLPMIVGVFLCCTWNVQGLPHLLRRSRRCS